MQQIVHKIDNLESLTAVYVNNVNVLPLLKIIYKQDLPEMETALDNAREALLIQIAQSGTSELCNQNDYNFVRMLQKSLRECINFKH